jgi:hypothetical protein
VEQKSIGTLGSNKSCDIGTSVECVGTATKAPSVDQLQVSDKDVEPSYSPSEETVQQNFESFDPKVESGVFETHSVTSVDYEDDAFLDAFTLEK